MEDHDHSEVISHQEDKREFIGKKSLRCGWEDGSSLEGQLEDFWRTQTQRGRGPVGRPLTRCTWTQVHCNMKSIKEDWSPGCRGWAGWNNPRLGSSQGKNGMTTLPHSWFHVVDTTTRWLRREKPLFYFTNEEVGHCSDRGRWQQRWIWPFVSQLLKAGVLNV